MENPNQITDGLIESLRPCDFSPYKRYIHRLYFEDNRTFIYDVRGKDMNLVYGEGYFEDAKDLKSEWDGAIQEFWRASNSAVARSKRARKVKKFDQEQEWLYKRSLPEKIQVADGKYTSMVSSVYHADPRILKNI